MGEVFSNVDFLEENGLYKEGTTDIDLTALAKLLEIQQKDLAKAFGIHESSISRTGTLSASGNDFLKQWLKVFNILAEQIKATEPQADKERVRIKIGRWLKTPNSHFKDMSPLEMMIDGKTRRVLKLLEQITG